MIFSLVCLGRPRFNPRRPQMDACGPQLDGLLERRAFWASVTVPIAAAGFTLFFSACLAGDWPSWCLAGGALALGPAQLLRAAAVLRRCAGIRPPTIRSAAVSLLAVGMTAVATSLLAAGVRENDLPDDCGVFGGLIGSTALLRLLADGRVLEWTTFPRESAHRRFKAHLFAALFVAVRTSGLCVVLAAWWEGSSIFSMVSRSRLLAGMLVLLAAEYHADALQVVASSLVSGLDQLRAADLVEALAQPLTMTGPGLGRWVAMTAMAQAVAHRQQCTRPSGGAGAISVAGAARCSDAASVAGSFIQSPTFAAEVFSRRPVGGGDRPGSVGSGCGGDAGGSTSLVAPAVVGPLDVGAPSLVPAGADPGVVGSRAHHQLPPPVCQGGSGAGGGGLFSAYLLSGLEVMREYTFRLQCVIAASQRQGVDALLPEQLAVLDARIVELSPLMRVAAAGLTGWLCASRDLDVAGVVQRQDALRKVLYELCGMICALESLLPVAGEFLGMSAGGVRSVRDAREEARHSLEELLVTFEHAGLRLVKLPPLYRRLVTSLLH